MRRLSIHPLLITMIVSGAILALGISVVGLSLATEPDEHPAFLQLPTLPTSRIVDRQRPFYAENIQVEINPAATQPVTVQVQGNLSDGCHRMRLGLVHYREQTITATLYTGYRHMGDTGCTLLTRPTTLSFPLDVAALTPGDYTLLVSGLTHSLTISPELIAVASHSQPSDSIEIDKIQYFAQDEAGHPFVRIQGRYLKGCPYFISVVQQTNANAITIRVNTPAGDPTAVCDQNSTSEIMPLDIPLDLIGLPIGEYTLRVGDKETKFNLDSPLPTPELLPTDISPSGVSYPSPQPLPM